MTRIEFPEGFRWGTATSATQIEGAAAAEGKGESIWDRFASMPENIEDASDPAIACDHYHRWEADVERLAWLGAPAYRFSLAWPRIIPLADGRVNEAGLAFYDRLVDRLLERGIEPCVTLYHWDLPQVLEDRGGWARRSTAERFVEYASVAARRLGDRVRCWMTHNEPWCISVLGYEEGHHAPGRIDPPAALRAAHHLLLSHGWACEMLRREVSGAEVGIVLNLTPSFPASDRPEDIDAARWFDGFFNRWFLDPLFVGRYPEDSIEDRIVRGHLESESLPFVQPGDMQSIAAPMDFLGVNYYSRAVMRSGEDRRPVAVPPSPEPGVTDMGWELYPTGLTDLLVRLHREYGPSRIYITENGAAYTDPIDADGRVEDTRRIAYHRSHLLALHRAMQQGVPVAGYFAWTFMDNFEWSHGYTKRFGLFGVDRDTLSRVPRDSAYWYRDVVAANAMTDAVVNPS